MQRGAHTILCVSACHTPPVPGMRCASERCSLLVAVFFWQTRKKGFKVLQNILLRIVHLPYRVRMSDDEEEVKASMCTCARIHRPQRTWVYTTNRGRRLPSTTSSSRLPCAVSLTSLLQHLTAERNIPEYTLWVDIRLLLSLICVVLGYFAHFNKIPYPESRKLTYLFAVTCAFVPLYRYTSDFLILLCFVFYVYSSFVFFLFLSV